MRFIFHSSPFDPIAACSLVLGLPFPSPPQSNNRAQTWTDWLVQRNDANDIHHNNIKYAPRSTLHTIIAISGWRELKWSVVLPSPWIEWGTWRAYREYNNTRWRRLLCHTERRRRRGPRTKEKEGNQPATTQTLDFQELPTHHRRASYQDDNDQQH